MVKTHKESDFFDAIKSGRWKKLKKLLTAGHFSPDIRSASGSPAIVKAITNKKFRGPVRESCALKTLTVLLNHGANVSATDSCGRSSSMWAAYYGFLDCLKLLVESGANLDLIDNFGYSHTAIAVLKERKDCVDFLQQAREQRKGDPEAQDGLDPSGVTRLLRAVSGGDCDSVEKLVQTEQFSPNTCTVDGLPLLMYRIDQIVTQATSEDPPPDATAALAQKDILLASLMNCGADANLRDRKGWTAIMKAAQFALFECLKYLIDAGSDVGLANKDGDNALMIAIAKSHGQCAKLLLQHTPCLDHRNKSGKTALMLAETLNLEVIEELLKSGSSTNIQDRRGASVLHIAARAYCPSVYASHYIAHGAEVNLATHSGETPLIGAAREGNQDIVEALLTHGARVDARDKHGYTALLYSLGKDHLDLEIPQMLMQYDSDVNVKGVDGKTPLGWTLHHYYSLGRSPREDADEAELRYFKMVTALFDAGADMTLCVNDQAQFSKAVIGRAEKLIQLMISNGCPPYWIQPKDAFDNRVNRLRSPLDIARTKEFPEIARYILANRYLTKNDLKEVGFTTFRKAYFSLRPKDEKAKEIEIFLTEKPFSLMTLSFVAVSTALYDDVVVIEDEVEDEDDGWCSFYSDSDEEASCSYDEMDSDCNSGEYYYSDDEDDGDDDDNDDVDNVPHCSNSGLTRGRAHNNNAKLEDKACAEGREESKESSASFLGESKEMDIDKDEPSPTRKCDCDDGDESTSNNRSSNSTKSDTSVEGTLQTLDIKSVKSEGPSKQLHPTRPVMALTRQEKVNRLPLPQYLKDALLFRLPIASIHPSLWQDIKLDNI